MSDRATGFPHVFGHADAADRLCRAIERDQLHHAMIVVGPRGIGKAAFAEGLACALHCTRAPGRGCGACSICHRIAHRHHAGVEWLEPETPGGAIKVEQARELALRLEHAPFEGRHHVVIFDPADALTEQAYNALLKCVEEPRPGVHFVMLTTGLDRLLPTILSRCLAVRLGRLDDATTQQVVRKILGERDESAAVDEERLALAVRLCDGSPGVALELMGDAQLDAAFEVLQLGTVAVDRGVAGIFGGDGSALWDRWNAEIGSVKTGRAARERALAGRVAELWLLHLREQLRGRPGLPGVASSPAPEPAQILPRIDRLSTLLEALDRNANARLAFEQTMLDLSQTRATGAHP